jgi:P4 family phage/plasmid primase-like protien
MIPAAIHPVETAIDPNAIHRFAQVVFDGLSGFADVRLLAEKGMPEKRPQCRSLRVDDELSSALTRCAGEAAAMGRACFAVPATVPRPGRARAASVVETAVIVVDLDHGGIEAKRAFLVEHLGPPTLVVASGGVTRSGQPKLHLYWRLCRPATGFELARVCRLRATIARKVGGDSSFARASQPIRVAGSVHCKHGTRAPVRIIADTDRAHELDVLEQAVESMPAIDAEGDAEEEERTGGGTRAGPIRAGGLDGVTRFDALSRFMGEQIRRTRLGQFPRAEAWRAVAAYNANTIVPGWSEARLRREFDALELVDQLNHGRGSAGAYDGIDRTEHGLARRLAEEHADEWRYVAGHGWLAWTGSHWRPDDTSQILELCRRLCAEATHNQADSDRRRLLSDRTIRAVERLARSDPRIAASAAEWDTDPMLLNTPAGVVDLRTGEMLASDPGMQLTRITRASPGSGCPLWSAFIARITGRDLEVAAYLQRMAGYCLTGRTDEQAFFFLHGAGANGKTVFLEVLADVLGSYARAAPLDTFMAARGDRQPIDLAALEGARMVVATETEAGRPWAEARIKAITGGDRIAVRRLYQAFYETTPGYKLLISGNHRPRLSGGGSAMARRLHLIPFDTVIPEHERDGRLREKLVEQRDGILSWMLEGCRAWQETGLQAPRKVRDAVAAYLDSEDLIGQWIAECCEVGEHLQATSAELYASWRKRAEALGIESGNARDLGERLRDLGFGPFRDRRARGWRGLRPLSREAAEAPEDSL